MKKTFLRKTIEVCDFCERPGFLQTCPVCNRQFCLTCRGIVGQCWVDLVICRGCEKREDVQRVSDKYAAEITPIIKRRLRALKRLPDKAARAAGGTDE